jgi:hypothetical protein
MLRGFVLAVLLVAAVACATTKRPGTGDVAFRLHWQGEDDLDLHVKEPSGEELSFLWRKSESGGELDVDCNAAPEQICKAPIENVFWPVGQAPTGRYTYWVELFQKPESEREIPFTLEVLLGTTVVHTQKGMVSLATRSSERWQYDFLRREAVGKRK